MRSARWCGLVLVAVILGLTACKSSSSGDGGGGGGGGGGTTPTVTLSIAPTNGTVIAGQSTTTAATIVRGGGFTGTVTIGATGAPAGVTVTGGTIAAGATTQVVTIATTGAATAGNVNLSITGTAAGVTIAPSGFALTIQAPAVASVDVTPATSSVLVGQTVQLNATPRDASGNALTGRTIDWSSSNTAVATVSAAGLVTTLLAGTADITATVESQQNSAASAAIEAVDPASIPAFRRPFQSATDPELSTQGYFDHDLPGEGVDSNGEYLSWWGESSMVSANGADGSVDGSEGYDWLLAEDTPLFAVADGEVTLAQTSHAAVACAILGTDVTDTVEVRIRHSLPGGVEVESLYRHLNSIDAAVTAGARVVAGQPIGLSGNTGCSPAPHLHFQVNRLTQLPAGVTSAPIDPYGWDGPGADPWEAHAQGAQSIYLWELGEAPTLFRNQTYTQQTGVFFRTTRVRFQGPRDADNPNNELIEVALDQSASPTANIGNAYITTLAGEVYRFPAGIVLDAGRPSVRVYAGSGADTATDFYMGEAAGVLDNRADCVQLFNAANLVRNTISWGGGCRQIDPTPTSVKATGPFSVATIAVGSGHGFDRGTIYYPLDATVTFGAVALAPGLGGFWVGNNNMEVIGQHLASHGFVIIGIDTLDPQDLAVSRGGQLLAALDYLTQSSPVRNRVDGARLATSGYSMGAGGAVVAALQRPTLKAVAALSPPLFEMADLSALTVPSLFYARQNDTVVTAASVIAYYDTLPADTEAAYVEFAGAVHTYLGEAAVRDVLRRAWVPWLKLFVDSDTRYAQFLCPGLADLTDVTQYRQTCPLELP